MHNFTVIYTDNLQKSFEALQVIEKGVIIGRIIDGEFVDCGFISKRNIKEIRNGIDVMGQQALKKFNGS